MATTFANVVSPLAPSEFFLSKNRKKNYLMKKHSAVYRQENSWNLKVLAGSLKRRVTCGYGGPDMGNIASVCGRPVATSSMEKHGNGGIGIVDFLQAKTFLITGGTGFLAKVLIQKLLRSVPDIHKIYLMIKAPDKEAATERLKNEIIKAEIFKLLKEKYGKAYQNFMLSKLIPVAGDVCEFGLGLEETMADMISSQVHVIINSAANTNFDERYDVSININTKGTARLLDFAKTCKNLKLFLHVSTAYVNGSRNGRITEKPLRMGDYTAHENFNSSLSALNVEKEMQLDYIPRETLKDNSFMRRLGLERAKKYGWHDTYTFTKAMGEMMLGDMRGEVPLVIIRPSVIESTYKDPFSGWIQGNRMGDPLIILYGKGQLTSYMADPHCVIDVVPADMVVNVILAAIAKHGKAKAADVNVYQVASSVVNPLTLGELFKLLFEHFKSSPYIDPSGKPIDVATPLTTYLTMEEFAIHLERDMARQCDYKAVKPFQNPEKLKFLTRKLMEQMKRMVAIHKPYLFFGGRFDCSNTQKLMHSMSEEEKVEFGIDIGSIDWEHYVKNVHIPGLRKHVMKDKSNL